MAKFHKYTFPIDVCGWLTYMRCRFCGNILFVHAAFDTVSSVTQVVVVLCLIDPFSKVFLASLKISSTNYRSSRLTRMDFSIIAALLFTISISSAEVFCKEYIFVNIQLLREFVNCFFGCIYLFVAIVAIKVTVNLCDGGLGCCGSGMHTPGPSGEYLGADGKISAQYPTDITQISHKYHTN